MGIRELREKHSPLFQEFFASYPRKVDRQPALDMFVELMEEGLDPSLIINKARSFAQNVDPKDLKFVPSPRSWLRDRKWEDEDLFTDQVVAQREWLRGAWRRGDARSVSEKYGFPYNHPPVPAGVEDLEVWHDDQRKAWIAAVALHILEGGPLP